MNVDDGRVSTREITDNSLIGKHELKFVAFLIDIDPSGLYSYSLPLTLTIEVVHLRQFNKRIAEITGSLSRRAPISTSNIAPVYYAFLNQSTLYSFHFADPLAVESSQGIASPFADLTPGKLAISISNNELPAYVRKE